MSYRHDAWTDGEQVVFAALCEKTKAVEEKNAFKGVLPPQLDAWALNISGGPEAIPFKTMVPTEIKFDGIIQGQFSPGNRDLAQRTSMQWLAALPIVNREDSTKVVYVARATRPPEIDWGYIPVVENGKEVSKVGTWRVILRIECVFRTNY